MICEIGETKEGKYVIKGVESYKKSTRISSSSSMPKNSNLPNGMLTNKSANLSNRSKHVEYSQEYDYYYHHQNRGQDNVNDYSVLSQRYNNKSPRSTSTLKSNNKVQQSQHVPQIFSSSSSISTNMYHHNHSLNNHGATVTTAAGASEYSKMVNGIEAMNIISSHKSYSPQKSSNIVTNHNELAKSSRKFSMMNTKTSEPQHNNLSSPSSSSCSSGNKRIEIRRKYYVKVTPINTKYIAIVKTITNNTPLLLCFEHGKDRHPKEIINLKNSNIYKGVTEKGPCICIRPKNESKYKTIEIIEDKKNAKTSTNLKGINDIDNHIIKNTIIGTDINNHGEIETLNNSDNSNSPSRISSNSVTMYEVECHIDFEIWCNFFTSIGISLCSFRSLFHTTKLIGEGSFAKVYKGKNVINGEDVVLKAVDKKKVKESNVYTEIEVLRKVHHPHIVHFIASFEEEDHVCLVLEFLGGGELFEWIAQKGAYTEDQAKIAMKRVLLALQWLHANNVVHRDLKTENLILENRNSPESLKIIDFGLAASLGSPAMKMRCGSPGYVAPEILEDKVYSTKVDVFSIGVVLYTILGGSPPFPGSNMKEILKKNIQGHVQFNNSRWKNISSSVKDLIKWMMAKDPESRCTAAQAIYHPWFEKIQLSPGLVISTFSNSSGSGSKMLLLDHAGDCYNSSTAVASRKNQLKLSNGDDDHNIANSSNSPPLSLLPCSGDNVSGGTIIDTNIGKVSVTCLSQNKSNKTSINNKDRYQQQHPHNSSSCLANSPARNAQPVRKFPVNINTHSKFYSTHSSNNQHQSPDLATNNKSTVSISSLEYTDSHLSSSINSMKISPRSAIVPSSSSNRKLSVHQNHSPSQIRSYCNSSNNNSISEKLAEVEDEEDEDFKLLDKNKSTVAKGRSFNPEESISKLEEKETNCCEYYPAHSSINDDSSAILTTTKDQPKKNSSKLPETDVHESFGNNSNFHTIYYAATIHEDNFSYEKPIPIIGNIISSNSNNSCKNTLSSGTSNNNTTKLQSINTKSPHKPNKSNSIKAVLQNVFSRFSSSSSSSNNASNSNKSNQGGGGSSSSPNYGGKNFELN